MSEHNTRADNAGFTSWSRTTVPVADVVGWDVSAVTPAEVAAIQAFIDRRLSLAVPAHARFAHDLATRLAGKVTGIPTGVHPEYIIEGVLITKEQRR